MATIVTRAGKGSALTHNEVDANFTNLNNVFPNVAAPIGASNLELDLLDGVTATTAELNKVDDSAAAVANYTSVMRNYRHNNGSNATNFSVTGSVSESTWESVGPTGSSADNTWTALDDLPTAARIAYIRADLTLSGANDSNPDMNLYIRVTGSSTATGPLTKVAQLTLAFDDFSAVNGTVSYIFAAPLDSSRRFDAAWAAINDDAATITIYLLGFGV